MRRCAYSGPCPSVRCGSLSGLLLACLIIATVRAEGWPTFGGGSDRGGRTDETVVPPLQHVWTHRPAQTPRPAWADGPAPTDYWNFAHPLLNASDFDHAFHTAVVDGRLFYGSSADDALRCLDADSGEELWSFVTGGPVRIAPTVHGDRVLVASDDGCVYGLESASGRLVWTYRAARSPQRLPGNQRLISRWPVRCGIALGDDTAYVAAGVFPSEGADLCAVRVGDGSEVWRAEINVCPQGHLAAVDDFLVVPTGRTAPAVFDRRDGKLRFQMDGTGSTCAAALPDMIVYGPDERGQIHIADPSSGKRIFSVGGRRMTAAGDFLYLLGKSDLAALRRGEFLDLVRQLAATARGDESKRKELQSRLEGCRVWRTPLEAPHALAMAGQMLLAGGDGVLEAVDAATGERRWTGRFEGSARGLSIADGRLYVSTSEGLIHCFSPAGSAVPVAAVATQSVVAAPPTTSDELSRAAMVMRGATGDSPGYVLVLGDDDGRLALEIAGATRLHAVALASTEELAQAARRRLLESGWYGRRVGVLAATGGDLPFPSGCFNAVTSHAFLKDGTLDVTAAEIRRVLRPCGGTLVLAGPSRAGAELNRWWSGPAMKDSLENTGVGTWVYRRGPLDGAGSWTHALAEPGNSACSGDQLVSGPLELQWFGPPGAARMPDRHHRNVPPLYHDGRLFIAGSGLVWSVDAYNGTPQWQIEIPGAIRLGAFLDSSHTLVDERFLYVAVGDQCLRFDVATGHPAPSLHLPAAEGEAREWGHLAWEGPMLYGSSRPAKSAYTEQNRRVDASLWGLGMKLVWSDALLGIDRSSGQHAWQYRSGLVANTTLAAGEGRLYFVEAARVPAGGALSFSLKQVLQDGPLSLVALEGRTGSVLYRVPLESIGIEEVLYLNYHDGKLLLSGSRAAGRKLEYAFQVFAAETGRPLWRDSHPTELDAGGDHGEQNRHPTIVDGTAYIWPHAYELETGRRREDWKMDRRGHGCGGVAASQSAILWRGGTPWMQDLCSGGEARRVTTVTRPGCWINMIPAGGLVLIPEASSGCTCPYALQTTMALVPTAGWNRPAAP
ncbi:MAG: PQQ-binding-like beta-propeller repeat protein [Pirellulaceae bacterium]|nr:PQQ-binding-like beta-propeller repeat protein [Pirellulaceae bacterium]